MWTFLNNNQSEVKNILRLLKCQNYFWADGSPEETILYIVTTCSVPEKLRRTFFQWIQFLLHYSKFFDYSDEDQNSNKWDDKNLIYISTLTAISPYLVSYMQNLITSIAVWNYLWLSSQFFVLLMFPKIFFTAKKLALFTILFFAVVPRTNISYTIADNTRNYTSYNSYKE